MQFHADTTKISYKRKKKLRSFEYKFAVDKTLN